MRNLKTIVGVCVAGIFITGCGNNKAETAVDATPAEIVFFALDISRSTPLTDTKVLSEALKDVDSKIETLPVGSIVQVFTVGEDAAAPLVLKLRIQKRSTSDGDIPYQVAKKVREQVTTYTQQLKSGAVQKQGSSSLAGAIYDASKSCKQSQCSMFYITDGVDSDFGHGGLPKTQNMSLQNMDVTMYGFGRGLQTKQRLALEDAWKKYMVQYKPKSFEVKRL